jgi:hypothetical protein
LFKEIIVDRKLLGKDLSPFIMPIAACNPYKLKGKNDTFTAGLIKVKED